MYLNYNTITQINHCPGEGVTGVTKSWGPGPRQALGGPGKPKDAHQMRARENQITRYRRAQESGIWA
jgi:hypothetical protein